MVLDKGLSVLSQYGMEAKNTYRGRGALLVQTEGGLYLIQEFRGSKRRLEKQNELLENIEAAGYAPVDKALRNQEGSLVSLDADGTAYLVRQWMEGRECDTRSREDILQGVRTLAKLHNVMYLPAEQEDIRQPLQEEYIRHNREFKKIQQYIKQRRQKSDFENLFLASVEEYAQYGMEAAQRLGQCRYPELKEYVTSQGAVCHGECSQHNFMVTRTDMVLVHFDHWCYDLQIADLAYYMRKILEKQNWDLKFGMRLMEEYDRIKPFERGEDYNLLVRLSYPEKYWKLANHYYNQNKALPLAKDRDKMKRILDQTAAWRFFVKKSFSNFLFR